MAELPETLEELCDYIDTYSKSIYVREQINGVWCSVALSDLPGNKAIHHALRFIKEGRLPARVEIGYGNTL